MKSLFLAAGIIGFCLAASAQENNNYEDFFKRFKKPLVTTPALPRYDALRKNNAVNIFRYNVPSFPSAQLLFTLPDRSRVYALPQDHMPCIVPDMSQLGMPNPGMGVPMYRYPAPGAIPNPALNQYAIIIPGK